MSSLAGDYIPDDWTLVAELDQSPDYSVDITAIYRTPAGTLALVSASGCSCWGGEYTLDGEYDSLELLALAVFATGGECQRYPSSVRGYLRLFADALNSVELPA